MTGADTEVKSSWADDSEDHEVLPPPSEVVENGVKITTEYKLDENGKKVKIIREYKVEKRVVSKPIAIRKSWHKYGQSRNDKDGPNPSTTVVAEDVFVQFITNKEDADKPEDDPLNKLKNQKCMVTCRICKEYHWTTHCPFKDTLGPLHETLGDDKKAAAPAAVAVEEKKGVSSSKYLPPSRREGGNRVGESMQTSRRDEQATIRVTNLSENTREQDLQDLFKPFGLIQRLYLAKDKNTGQSKGFAFINFTRKEDAARAIDTLNGYGYDHLILNLEWAKPSGGAT